MAPSLLVFIGLGVAILAVAWMPLLLRRLPLSFPMVAVAAGALLAFLFGAEDFPFTHREIAERITEFVLIIAVMGAGLKIDRQFGWRRWASTWRLLAVAMPLSVGGIAVAGYGLLGLPIGVAMLLGGILAPTDPVLASAVQVGPPGSGEEDEVRFALTSEAGLNDGAAFPVVHLGLLMLLAQGSSPVEWVQDWLLVDVLWKLPAAAAIGFVLGWSIVRVNLALPATYRLSRSRDGLVSVGLTLLAYGLAEAAHSYGFVAVFVTAVTLRNTGRAIEYAQQLYDFADQVERLVTVLALALFGAAVAGGLLAPVTWATAGFAVVTLFVVRPLACAAAFAGSGEARLTQLALGYFGIRGLGSLYYMSYAADHGLENAEQLWAVVGLVVLMSVVVYGVSAAPFMRRLDAQCRWRSRTGGTLEPAAEMDGTAPITIDERQPAATRRQGLP